MISVLLIGSNPSERSINTTAFHSSTRSRMVLDQWFNGIDVDVYYENVCDRTRPGNRPLRVSEIRESLPRLSSILNHDGFRNCKVVALGKTASKALSMLEVEYMEMPHPSGLNRFWNDKDKAEAKIKELHKYLGLR